MARASFQRKQEPVRSEGKIAAEIVEEFDSMAVKAVAEGIAMADDIRNNGPVGRLLKGLHETSYQAVLELIDVDSTDVAEINRLQTIVKQYRAVVAQADEILRLGEELIDQEAAEFTIEDE